MGKAKTIMGELVTLAVGIQNLKGEAMKADEGNKAAGTRVRNALQKMKTEVQDIRILILKRQKKK